MFQKINELLEKIEDLAEKYGEVKLTAKGRCLIIGWVFVLLFGCFGIFCKTTPSTTLNIFVMFILYLISLFLFIVIMNIIYVVISSFISFCLLAFNWIKYGKWEFRNGKENEDPLDFLDLFLAMMVIFNGIFFILPLFTIFYYGTDWRTIDEKNIMG